MSDEQTFIEAKQHPQAGAETTHTMCEKFENFWKNRIFEIFLTIFYAPPPHRLITDYQIVRSKKPQFENVNWTKKSHFFFVYLFVYWRTCRPRVIYNLLVSVAIQ